MKGVNNIRTIEKTLLSSLIKSASVKHIYSDFVYNGLDVCLHSIYCCEKYCDNKNIAKQNVLLIHGMGGNIGSFAHTVDRLVTRFNLYIMDLPGYGQSCVDPVKMKRLNNLEIADFYVNVLKIYIDSVVKPNAGEKVSLFGYSFGALIVADFVDIYPNRVDKMILIAPAGVFTFGGFFGYYIGLLYKLSILQYIVRFFGTYSVYFFANIARLFSFKVYYDLMLLSYKHVCGDILIAKFIEFDKKNMFQMCNNYPLVYKILNSKCKTALIYHENDVIVPVQQGYKLHEMSNKSIPLYVIKKVGHAITFINAKCVTDNMLEAYTNATIPEYRCNNKGLSFLSTCFSSCNLFKNSRMMRHNLEKIQ